MKRTLSLILTLSMLLSILVTALAIPAGAVTDPMSEHLLVNFDFENSASPYQDASGKYTLGFTKGNNAGNGVYADGMLKTLGGDTQYISFNSTFLSGVTDQMTIVMKMKMDTMNNFFLRWCNSTSGAQQYRAKFEATGMTTSVDPATGSATWNKKTDIVTSAGTWYYVAISLSDSASGLVESLHVMTAGGDTVMSGTHTWTDARITVAGMAASQQWLQIGRYDMTYLDDLRVYKKAFDADDAKGVFAAMATPDEPAIPEEPEEPEEIAVPAPILKFDFENASNPMKDTTGIHSFTFTGNGGSTEGGVLKTTGDGTNYMSLNSTIMSGVGDQLTIVLKMKMETMTNFFLRWCDSTSGAQQYLAKLEESGMSTYFNAWNKKNGILASTDTWYYVGISLADSAAGVVETLNVMPVDGDEVMTATYTWTDSTFRVSSLAAGKQWLQIGRYDVTYLDELCIYNKAFNAKEAKQAFLGMISTSDSFLSFDFENTNGTDTSGAYTMSATGHAVLGNGAVVSNGITEGTNFLSLSDNKATLFDTVTDTLTVVQRFKADSFGGVQYSLYDMTGERWVHRIQFNASTGVLMTSVGLKWHAYTDIKAALGEWYCFAVSLTQTSAGIKETVFLCAADGTTVMMDEFVWNTTNLAVTEADAAFPDLTALKEHNTIFHFGRYVNLTLDEFKLYNFAFGVESFRKIAAELNGIAPDPILDVDFAENGSYDVEGIYPIHKYGAATVENGIAISAGAANGQADRFELSTGSYLAGVADAMTVSVMFRVDVMPDADRQFFRIYNSTTQKDIVAVYCKPDGTVYTRYGGGVADTKITGMTVTPGKWYVVTLSLKEQTGTIAHTLSLTSFEGAETVSASNSFANGGISISFADGKPLVHMGRFFPVSFKRVSFYNDVFEDHAMIADQVTDHYLFAQYDFEGTVLGTQLADKAPIGSSNAAASVEGERVIENGVITLRVPQVNGNNRINISTKDYKELVRSDVTFFTTLRVNDLKGDIFLRMWDITNNYHAVSLKALSNGGISYIADASQQIWGNTSGITLTEGTFYNLAVTLEKLSSNGVYATYRQTIYASPATVSGPAYMMVDVAEVILCDLDMGEKSLLTQLGRYGDSSFADFRMYASALSAQSVRDLFAQNNLAPEETAPEFIGVQTLRDFDVQNGNTFGIRFVAGIDSLDYSRLGFKIQALYAGGEKREKALDCEYVYTTLNAMNGKTTMAYDAADFGAAYLMALSITGIPEDTGTVTFLVTPYGVREYGDPLNYLMLTETVYGVTYEVSYNSATGVLDYKTVGATATEREERGTVGTGADEGAPITLAGATSYTLTYRTSDALAATVLSQVASKVSPILSGCGLANTVKVGIAGTAEAPTIELVLLSDGYKHSFALEELCNTSGRYVVTFHEKRIVIAGYDVIDLLNGVYVFVDMLKQEGSGSFTFYPSDYFYSGRTNNQATPDKAAAAALYRELFGTYASYAEWAKAEMISSADRNDQALIEALIKRMGNGFAVSPESSSVLYNGRIEKLDSRDYSKLTYLDGAGHIWIASEFARAYFGAAASFTEANGMMDLTLFCSQNTQYTLYYNASYRVAVVSDPGMTTPFSAATLSTVVSTYTDGQYMARMQKFFAESARIEPGTNAEQSRVEISAFPFDSSVIHDYTVYPYQTHYSPSICKVGSTIYVSYEDCYVTNFATETGNRTMLVRSTDGGKTWELLGTALGMRWANVFELNGKIYVMGTHLETAKAQLAEYNPSTGVFRYDSLDFYGGAGAPCAGVVANGRFYKSSGTTVISISVNADLFDYSAWTVSERADNYASEAWFRTQTGFAGTLTYGAALGEGNLIVGKDGTVYAMFRVDSQPLYGYAVLIKCSADGKTLSEPRLIRFPADANMPSSISKFTVRYDEASGKYFSLVSTVTVDQNDAHAHNQRNVLSLIVSEDLVNWSFVCTVLVDRDMINSSLSRYVHAFQYVDFVIDGDSIHLVVREATGETNTYHDGKYVTYYVIENFRDLMN